MEIVRVVGWGKGGWGGEKANLWPALPLTWMLKLKCALLYEGPMVSLSIPSICLHQNHLRRCHAGCISVLSQSLSTLRLPDLILSYGVDTAPLTRSYASTVMRALKIPNTGSPALTGMGSAALVPAVPYPGKATLISHNGLKGY